jgi:hypothetical protein
MRPKAEPPQKASPCTEVIPVSNRGEGSPSHTLTLTMDMGAVAPCTDQEKNECFFVAATISSCVMVFFVAKLRMGMRRVRLASLILKSNPTARTKNSGGADSLAPSW